MVLSGASAIFLLIWLSHVPYSGKLSRKKTFTNFAVLWLFAKAKFGHVAPLVLQKRAIRESFLRESFLENLESFPLYSNLIPQVERKVQKLLCDMSEQYQEIAL